MPITRGLRVPAFYRIYRFENTVGRWTHITSSHIYWFRQRHGHCRKCRTDQGEEGREFTWIYIRLTSLNPEGQGGHPVGRGDGGRFRRIIVCKISEERAELPRFYGKMLPRPEDEDASNNLKNREPGGRGQLRRHFGSVRWCHGRARGSGRRDRL